MGLPFEGKGQSKQEHQGKWDKERRKWPQSPSRAFRNQPSFARLSQSRSRALLGKLPDVCICAETISPPSLHQQPCPDVKAGVGKPNTNKQACPGPQVEPCPRRLG